MILNGIMKGHGNTLQWVLESSGSTWKLGITLCHFLCMYISYVGQWTTGTRLTALLAPRNKIKNVRNSDRKAVRTYFPVLWQAHKKGCSLLGLLMREEREHCERTLTKHLCSHWVFAIIRLIYRLFSPPTESASLMRAYAIFTRVHCTFLSRQLHL